MIRKRIIQKGNRYEPLPAAAGQWKYPNKVMKTLGFIGAGNMGGAIIQAACKKLDPKDVVVYNRHREKADALSEKCGCTVVTSYEEVIDACECVMLCIKPQFLDGVLSDTLPLFKKYYDRGDRKIVASIVAAASLDLLTEAFSSAGMPGMPVIRMMPNTPVTVGQGLTIYSNNAFASDADVDALMDALEKGGLNVRADEHVLDISSPVMSCSPAFVYMFIEALADGGVEIGLFRDQAIQFAAQAVLGSAAMVLQTGIHPDALKDAVCSPGGITIAGVHELERHAFNGAVMDAVTACDSKTKAMAK